jgi:hypothetical protein
MTGQPILKLDAASVALVESDHAAKLLGAAGNSQRATLTHAYACRVAPDGRHVTVAIARSQSGPLLAALEQDRRVSLVACHVQSLTTLQLKGSDARLVAASAGEQAAAVAHCDEFARFGGSVGYDAQMLRAHMDCRAEDVVTIRFTLDQAFVQTPGPAAGQPLNPDP